MLKKALMVAAMAGALAGSGLAAEVFVRIAPPRAIVERPIARPGPNHVWVAGYHRWDGRAYVWVPGQWVMPPRRHAHWVNAHWVHRNHGWYFVEGHWR